ALKSLIKSHNQRNKGDPIRLDFESEDTKVQDLGIAKGKEVMDEDLGKPFKEARRTPLTRRIIKRMTHARMVSNVSTNLGRANTRMVLTASSQQHKRMDGLKRGIRCQEKGHYTNNCIQLRKQLEMALESRKLNHLVKDVRQRGRGPHGREAPQPAKLKGTQTDLVGFAEEISKPLGKIELEVCFGNEGRSGLKTLRAIPSTIHSMMKFLTQKGVATLVTRTIIIAECIRLEKNKWPKKVLNGRERSQQRRKCWLTHRSQIKSHLNLVVAFVGVQKTLISESHH
nr:reverse transcriptase domain-containing protein [Tanacetum cinerariifolium]